MKILHCEDVEDLCLNIIEKIECLIGEYGTISILAKYEIAKEIISELSIYRTLISIELHDPEYENYYDEYLIALDDEGIWCMPAKIDGKYLQDEPTILYVHQDCNSKALSKIKGKINVAFTCHDIDCDDEDCYDDDELDCDVDCENCQYNEDELEDGEMLTNTLVYTNKENTPVGFEKTWDTLSDGVKSTSIYSYFCTDFDFLKHIASEFDVEL